MICELCGRRTNKLYTVIIEGAKLRVCEECAKYGKIVPEREELKADTAPNEEEVVEEVLEEDWREKIKQKFLEENRKGKTIEEIAREWKIRESLLRSILNGSVEIDIETAKRFEKILGVKLVKKERFKIREKVAKKEEDYFLTLGDIVRIRVRS